MPKPTQQQIDIAVDIIADLIVEDYLLKKRRGKFKLKPKEMRPILPGFDEGTG